jgi:hypothetical protein
MSEQVVSDDQLIAAVRRFEPATAEMVTRHLHGVVTRQAIQARLDRLVMTGELVASDWERPRRYIIKIV